MRRSNLPLLLAAWLGTSGAAGSLLAQASPTTEPENPAPVREEVVVTAAGTPVEAANTGAGVTVIDRDAIERSRVSSLAELLRAVPGVDVVQAGSPGQVTSVLLRGADYRQVLVLVDGVRVNDPYFGGFDWAHMPAAGVERVEVVRGPYSALWGTDAVGGVIQVFTRRGAETTRVNGTLEAGNAGQAGITAGAGGASGPVRWSADASWRDGDGFSPNDDYDRRAGSATVELDLGRGSVGAEVRLARGRLGIPYEYYPVDGFPPEGKTPTPDRRAASDELLAAVPLALELGGGFRVDALLSRAEREYSFRDPQDAWGYTSGDTDSTRDGARAALRWAGAGHTASFLFDWSRDTVDAESSFGVALDGDETTIRGWALEDVWEVGGGVTVIAGVRRDDHSGFGATTHPRGSLAWHTADGRFRLSVAGGSAFRAPSVGELYYPYSGNPALEPERSKSGEAGVEWREANGAGAMLRLFTERTTDRIDFDPATYAFTNIGKSRSEGVELSASAPLGAGLLLQADATWLDAEKRVVAADGGESWDPLPRRPEWRGSARLGWNRGPFRAELRGLYVGRRPDVDPITLGPIEDPSYVRFDLSAGWKLREGIEPYLRVDNLLDREYDEAAGYRAPGRAWVVGLDFRM